MSSLGNFVKRLRDIMRNDAGINGDAQRIEQIAWLLFLKVYDTKEEDWETAGRQSSCPTVSGSGLIMQRSLSRKSC